MKKKRVRRKISKKSGLSKKTILTAIIILVLVLAVLTALQFNAVDKIHKLTKSPDEYKILDECSLILGNIIHTISNEDNCKVQCIDFCEVKKTKMHKSEFEFKPNSCHDCTCYCK